MIDKLALEKNEFEMNLAEFIRRVQQAKGFDDYEKEAEYVEIVNGIQDSILEAKAKGKAFNDREQVFGFPPTEFLELDVAEEELAPYWDLWNMNISMAISWNWTLLKSRRRSTRGGRGATSSKLLSRRTAPRRPNVRRHCGTR